MHWVQLITRTRDGGRLSGFLARAGVRREAGTPAHAGGRSREIASLTCGDIKLSFFNTLGLHKLELIGGEKWGLVVEDAILSHVHARIHSVTKKRPRRPAVGHRVGRLIGILRPELSVCPGAF